MSATKVVIPETMHYRNTVWQLRQKLRPLGFGCINDTVGEQLTIVTLDGFRTPTELTADQKSILENQLPGIQFE